MKNKLREEYSKKNRKRNIHKLFLESYNLLMEQEATEEQTLEDVLDETEAEETEVGETESPVADTATEKPAAEPTPAEAPDANTTAPEAVPASPAPAEEVEFTVDDMVERMNTIRGGRSFADPEVYSRLIELYNSFTPEQIGALDFALNGIGRAVTGLEDSEDAEEVAQPTPEKTEPAAAATPAPAETSAPAPKPAPAPVAPVEAV